jgi:hypothetical protein
MSYLITFAITVAALGALFSKANSPKYEPEEYSITFCSLGFPIFFTAYAVPDSRM